MTSEGDKQEARSEAARLLGSTTSPAKRAAALAASKLGGRKKGTPQTEETKEKIRQARIKQVAAKREAQDGASQTKKED